MKFHEKKVKKWGPAGPPVNTWILAIFRGSEKKVKKSIFFVIFCEKMTYGLRDLRIGGGSSVSAILKKKFLFLPDHFWRVHSRWKTCTKKCTFRSGSYGNLYYVYRFSYYLVTVFLARGRNPQKKVVQNLLDFRPAFLTKSCNFEP